MLILVLHGKGYKVSIMGAKATGWPVPGSRASKVQCSSMSAASS